MYRYTAKVRLGGSVTNEVMLKGVSAAEIMILRRLHGGDAIKDLQENKSDKSSHEDEREALKRKYCSSSVNRTKLNFEQMFGPEHMDLPNRLPELEKQAKTDAVSAEAASKGLKDPGRKSNVRITNKVDVDQSEVDMDAIAG